MNAVPLRDAIDPDRFGGKAAQLASALRAGLPVPDGTALATDLVAHIASGGEVDEASILAWTSTPVAARSSAVGEDGATASFAGQHLTCLQVTTPQALADAVRRIWESARSPSALAYRERLGLPGEPRMAVVVQQMVLPDCAGVLFTRNPVTGADERLVEASWGLGEAVVAGLVTPDQYRIERHGRVLERVSGLKDLALVADERGGTCEVRIEAGRARQLCLDDQMLVALEELAARCERHFGDTAQDLEWAVSRGALYLLQRRVVTRGAFQ